MALVTITTIFQTIHISIVVLLSKGWLYVRSVLTKNDLSGLTMLMGIVYISYSAMFVSANIANMQLFTKVWMNIVYVVILMYVLCQCIDTKSQVHA